MCGICGLVKKTGPEPDIALIKRMLNRLYHRGPDGRGWFRDKQAALGHTRLSIIDLTGGTQPLCNEDGSLWLSFNGEIYNYLELRKELIALGHVFKTKSDTEVILHSWESWGEECFNRFNGQWALAIWDRKNHELILSRDRHGIRPLYYTETKDQLLFASEIKALFADKTISRSFDNAGLFETFTYWGPLASNTVFNGIKELPPGNVGRFSQNGLTIIPYWSIRFPIEGRTPPSTQEMVQTSYELKERLEEAVRLRFERSDVPVGSYLSGGIDSSLCALIVKKIARDNLKTFSIRFSHPQFDEGCYQSEMVDYLGTDHKSFMVTPQDIGAVFPEVIRHTERPILRTAPAPLYLLSKLVRESGYKVVVTGEGADEVLGGYDIFREAYVRRQIAIKGETRETDNLLEQLYPWMGDAFKKTPAFTRSFFSGNLDINDPAFSHRPRWNNSRLMLPLLEKDLSREQKVSDVTERLLKQLPKDYKDWSYLSKAQWLEYKTLLSGYILSAQGDRMLMANSIEGRFPFLDVNLVEFANSLHPELKLRTEDLTEKILLKEAYINELPQNILNRSKQPYQSPNGISFFCEKNLPGWIKEVGNEDFIRESNIFNPAAVGTLLQKGRNSGEKGLSPGDNTRITTVLSTLLICKIFIKDNNFQTNIPRDWSANEFTADYCIIGNVTK